jgi:dihydrofolate reductase
VVVSRQTELGLPAGVLRAASLDEACQRLEPERAAGRLGQIFVIGGAELYRAALALPSCRTVHLTRLLEHFECDVHFGPLPDGFTLVWETEAREDGGLRYRFERWERPIPRPLG